MKDWKFIEEEFDRYGINSFQCRNAVISLDKVLGLDEKRHNDGINAYGVSSLHIFSYGIVVEYYKGSILKKYNVCSSSMSKMYSSKNDRVITDREEEDVYNFCISFINERIDRIEKNKYWVEHFDEFVSECLSYVREFLDDEYYVELSVGNTTANPSIRTALVIKYKSDGSQRGYISINKNCFGDIGIDSCCMSHTEFDIKDPSNKEDVRNIIHSACGWCM